MSLAPHAITRACPIRYSESNGQISVPEPISDEDAAELGRWLTEEADHRLLHLDAEQLGGWGYSHRIHYQDPDCGRQDYLADVDDTPAERALREGATRRRLEVALDVANGRRRRRTLGLGDLLDVVHEAARDEYDSAGGGTVANSYTYPAIQTVAFAARRDDGAVVLAVGVTSASRGACPRPRWVDVARLRPDSDRVRADCRRWANAQRVDSAQEEEGNLLILTPADLESVGIETSALVVADDG